GGVVVDVVVGAGAGFGVEATVVGGDADGAGSVCCTGAASAGRAGARAGFGVGAVVVDAGAGRCSACGSSTTVVGGCGATVAGPAAAKVRTGGTRRGTVVGVGSSTGAALTLAARSTMATVGG